MARDTDRPDRNKTLEDLLQSVSDEKERARLKALCSELALDDPLSDEDLEMLAAANDRQNFSVDGVMYGTELDESFTGRDGKGTIHAGGGDDLAFGGAGNDTITDFNPGADSLSLLGADSADDFQVEIVDGSTVVTFGSSTVTLTDVELTAEEIMDAMRGLVSEDVLSGAGDDAMTGGLGADTFAFNAGGGHDTVTDFDPVHDSLELLGADSMDNISVEVVDGDTVITFGDTTITLTGVEMTQEQVWARVVS